MLEYYEIGFERQYVALSIENMWHKFTTRVIFLLLHVKSIYVTNEGIKK